VRLLSGREACGTKRLVLITPASRSDAAAFVARKLGATFTFIESSDGRSLLLEAGTPGEDCDWTFRTLTEEALGESLAASFRLWEESDPGAELLETAVDLATAEALTPEATPMTLNAYPKEWREAHAQREGDMCRNITDLCSGTGPTSVLVIVGRDHVAPLIALLKAV
jgi:hypothetical protein